jgi:dihydrodipicolinate reductase
MINAAIFGLGRWGRNLVNAVQNSSEIKFVKAVVTNPQKHQDFVQQMT